MKKLITTMLMIALFFCSCTAAESVQYTIYISSFDDGQSSNTPIINKETHNNVTIADSSQKDFIISDFQIIENNDAIPQKQFSLNGEKYNFSLYNSYKTPIADSNFGKLNSLGFYDIYRFNGDNGDVVEVEFKQNSEVLSFYAGELSIRTIESGDFTPEQSKIKSDELLKSLYGEDALSTYVFDGTSICDSQTLKGFSVNYVRYVHGYRTDETITISFNRNGELVCINAMKIGFFNSGEKDISKPEIEAAEKVLKESINENWRLSETAEVVIDSTGQYFLSIVGTYTPSNIDENIDSRNFYININ